MKYDELKLGECVRYADVKDLLGDEMTFGDLAREPGTSKLFVWIGATVGGELQDETEFLIAQVERVVDFDPEVDTDPDDVEWATVMLDIPGWSSSPVAMEFEDMEEPELEEGDDPNRLSNSYRRVWRVKKALQPLEKLAIGAAIYSKCKANYIDTTEELLDALSSGLAKTVFSSQQIASIKTVLHNAHIEVPDIVPAVPDSPEREELLREDLKRGTGFEDGERRIIDHYSKNRPTDAEFAEYLKKEYGRGGHSGPNQPDVGYDSKGIHIRTADRARAYNYTWIEAAKTLRGMIENGEYLPEKQEAEIVEAAPAAPSDPWTRAKALHQRIVNDAQAAAESIWDMSQAIKEMRDGKHYKALLYDNFEGYCEEALGMSRAHAYRYIQIAEGMSAENVASMRQIGTTKLALLASVTEEQREIITTAVDVESATVKELKAEIDRLKGRVKEAEEMTTKQSGIIENFQRDNSALSSRIQRDQQEITKLKAETTNNSDYIGKINQQRNALEADNAQLKDRIRELESGRDHVLDELQAKIKELESRPVEVAVQDNSEELEQLRAEYEKKLEEAAADNEYKEVLAMCRLARQQVDAVCIRLKGIRAGKAKDSLIKYTKEIGLLLGQLN